MMQIESGISFRQLAKNLGLPYETVRDRVNNAVPSSNFYPKFPVEKLPLIDELVESGMSIRKVSDFLGLSKSSLHRHLQAYRKRSSNQ